VRSKASKADISQLNLPHCAVEHCNSAKKVSIRFDNPINLPLVHWYWNSIKLELIFSSMHFLQTNRFKSIRICSITNRFESRIGMLYSAVHEYSQTMQWRRAHGVWKTKVLQWRVRGRSPPPPKAHTILPVRIFGCQTMQNFVYLAKRYEPLAKHKKNLGCSSCLFAELSINYCNW